jgi:hypothetical protein
MRCLHHVVFQRLTFSVAVHVGLRGMITCFGDELPSLHGAIAERDDLADVGMGSATPSYEFGHH